MGLLVVLAIIGAIVGGSTEHSAGTAATVTRARTAEAQKHHEAAAAQRARAKPRRRFTRYAGLGATIADFKHDNTLFCLNSALQPGEAAYNIKGQRNGLVTAYQVSEAFKPAAGEATRLSLVTGTMIPGPIKDSEPIWQTPRL